MGLDEHRVRERAYYIWEDEGRVFGHADAHWLRAETELRAGPAVVQATAEAVSLAPSPAKVLKTRAVRATTTAEAVAGKAAKLAAKPAPKPASAKSAAAKPAVAKATAAKSAPKAATPRAARKTPAAGVALH